MSAAIGGLVICAALFGAFYLWETFKERTHEGTTSAKIVGGAEAIGEHGERSVTQRGERLDIE